jgi:hypothetical protein
MLVNKLAGFDRISHKLIAMGFTAIKSPGGKTKEINLKPQDSLFKRTGLGAIAFK